MIAAIILAAGKSERMGFPKALLRFEGTTFLDRILGAVSRSHLAHPVVVVGHHRKEIESAVTCPNLVYNPDYEQGMSTSVKAGIRALPPNVAGAAIFLVDHPLVDAETIDRLIRKAVPAHIVLPVHQGRRGHPVLFAADLFDEILQLGPDEGLNRVVRRDPARIIEIEAGTSSVLLDIDTPEQFDKLLHERS